MLFSIFLAMSLTPALCATLLKPIPKGHKHEKRGFFGWFNRGFAKATTSYEQFGLLAERISDDDFRVNMGNHKTVSRDRLPPQVLKAFLAMKSGQVSDTIQIEGAYTILRLNAHTPAGKRSFESVKAKLQAELQKQKYDQLRALLDKKLRSNAKVEVIQG